MRAARQQSRESSFVKSSLYSVSSNAVALIVPIVLLLVVPKSLDPANYGYWQLYLFYISYVGVFHFGWADGVFLRYGGKRFSDLDRPKMSTQFYLMAVLQSLFAAVLVGLAVELVPDAHRVTVLSLAAASLVIGNLKLFLLYLLQATYRIREYARIGAIDRLCYGSLVLLAIAAGSRNFTALILADLAGKAIGLALGLVACRSLFRPATLRPSDGLGDSWLNLRAGFPLMLANLAGVLMLGVVRLGVERGWDVETFGMVSLALNISGMLLVFVNAIGAVFYPVLMRTEEARRGNLYETVREVVTAGLLAALVLYFPVRALLSLWLPDYSSSIELMALVFPMIVFEGRFALISVNYFRAYRRQGVMLAINTASVIAAIGVTLYAVVVVHNLLLLVGAVAPLVAVRYLIADRYLARLLGRSASAREGLALGAAALFVVIAWRSPNWIGLLSYVGVLLLYVAVVWRRLEPATREARGFIQAN